MAIWTFSLFVGAQSSYEETRLNESDMGDKTKWLKEGMDCNLLYWKDKVISTFKAEWGPCSSSLSLFQVIDFELPITVQLKIVDVDPGLRGDTAQGTYMITFSCGWLVHSKLTSREWWMQVELNLPHSRLVQLSMYPSLSMSVKILWWTREPVRTWAGSDTSSLLLTTKECEI